MQLKTKTISALIAATILLGFNILAAVTFAAGTRTQDITLQIDHGNLTLAVPRTINFSRTIAKNGSPTEAVTILDPANSEETIDVIDPWSRDENFPTQGTKFHVDLSMDNFMLNPASGCTTDNCIPATSFGVIPLRNTASGQTVDTSSIPTLNGLPALDKTNNVTSIDSLYYDKQTTPLSSTTVYSNFDGIHTVSIMDRTVAPAPTAGIYSLGLAIHATIPDGVTPGAYQGELTFSLNFDSSP